LHSLVRVFSGFLGPLRGMIGETWICTQVFT
jgi:hypothetical protein